MGYNILELSRYSGKPIGLLRLSRGSLVELYTDADRPITRGEDLYLPYSIERTELRDSSERLKNIITLTMPVDVPAAPWWRPYPPSRPVYATWLEFHYGDDEVATVWSGRVIQPEFTDTVLQLKCEPTKASAVNRGLQLRWQRGCPLALYSQGVGMCNVDKDDFAVAATVTDFEGIEVTAAAFGSVPGGLSLEGGYIEWTRPDGEPEYRSVLYHDGTTVGLYYGADTLEDGMEVIAYPGCAHDWTACGQFDNQINYGGNRYAPTRSPFDGNLIG